MLKNKLKQLREEHGLSQVDLAEKLGKSQNTISSWETGRTMPRMKDMNALCGLYDCTLETLTGIKQFDANDITLEDILFRLSSLQTDDLKRLDAQIRNIIDARIEMQKVENEKQQLLEKLRSLEAYQKKIESAQ